ncbi:MAG: MATE family efflux transporter, partial [Thermoplasmata archaeon]|nr:MATE family efflux transporter [Thermoplasmata archaeon]
MDREINRKIITLAVPAIISTLLLTMQMIVDTIMLGRYPPAEVSLSALGLGSTLYYMFFPIVMGLSTGTIAIISRRWGEKRPKEAKRVATDTLTTLLLISIPISLFGFFAGPYIIYYLGARGMVITETSKYIMAVFAFYPFNVFLIAYHGIMIGAGNTKTPLFVNLLTNVYNIIMNYLLIFGAFGFPELGVLGAGIATGTSYLIGTIAYAILQTNNKLILSPSYSWAIKTRMVNVKKMFKIGIPAGIDMGMWAISSVFVAPIILYFGNIGYSAYQIGLRAESIAYMPGVGFGIAATTLAGQYLGAKKPDKAKAAVMIATKYVMLVMGIMGLVLTLVPKYIAQVFTSETEVIEIATLYLFLMGFSEPALGAIFTLTGGMRGAGYTKMPLVINFIGLIVIRISLLYLLAFLLGLGLLGIWLGMIIELFIRV